MRSLAKAVAVVLAGALGSPLYAQGEAHHGGGTEVVGVVRFPVTCTPRAQQRFARAVAYLHSFWYEKAGTAFGEVVAADSSCAMGYWGQAMSIVHPLWAPTPPATLAAGLALAERGLGLAQTPRERDYLMAIRAYYANDASADEKTRLEAYARAMAEVPRRNPADREAATFYGLALIALGQANPTDTTFTNQRRADSILVPLFKLQPRHPGLAHYLIHANDSPRLASLGLYAAQRYAGIAPDVPHAQHMPSHIFTRLGLWDESIASNTRSAAAARAFERAQHLDALWDQRGHAMDYLAYAYLQQGRDSAALSMVREAQAVTAGFPAGSLTNQYALGAIPARYALEREAWTEATALAVRPAPEWRAAEAITHFARALGAARRDGPDTALARQEIDSLAAIEGALESAGGAQRYWSRQVKIQRLAAQAWLTRTRGDSTGAAQVAREAADLEDVTEKHPVSPGAVLPARELEGDLLLAIGQPAAARTAYEASLARQPNRARSLIGAARAAERAGDATAARDYYQRYLTLMARADGERPEIRMARQVVGTR